MRTINIVCEDKKFNDMEKVKESGESWLNAIYKWSSFYKANKK